MTGKPEEVQVGFPVDSQFTKGSEPESSKESAHDWVLNYGFIALDETTTYKVEFVSRIPSKDAGEFGAVFVWKMNFAPRESRTLKVSYHIPMSIGLVSTERDEQATKSFLDRPGVLAQEL